MSKLLIVESPNKIKKIKSFLNQEYDVSASCGHFRNLDPKDMSIDIFKLRVENKLVNNQILKNNPDRLQTLEANAGTLILVDTSLLHRGSPIEEGSKERYAMTNYIYPYYQRNWYPSHFEKSLKRKFS